jgi:DNA-binding LacI/PurR family transcriptional regulator
MVTLKDIADKVGVNKSTVSRALSGSSKVASKTRDEIVRVANKLGYIPNETAKVLAGKKSKTVGLIIPELDCNYYAGVVGAIESKLKDEGYSLVIGQTGFKHENELHHLELFIRKNLDGVIISVYDGEKFTKEFDKIKRILKIPVVFIETYLDLPNFDVIEIDNKHGVDIAIDHLYSLGHRRIGFISEYLSKKLRLPAYIEALKKRGLSINDNIIKTGKERLEKGGYLRMKELLLENDIPTAVFISYDTMAQGALRAVSEEGMKPAEDISIVGFDNIRESAYFSTSLTTIAPPLLEMGEVAVDTLLNKINKENSNIIRHISLKPKLVLRDSTGSI